MATYTEELEARILKLELERRTDPLTGAGNLLAFREACEAWDGAACAILLDATNLKRANTELGHFGADAVLKAMADVLREGFDLVGRHGGDEFFVVLPGCAPADAEKVRDRIEAAVKSVLLASGAEVRLVGAVAINLDYEGLQAADERLEARKAAWKEATGQDRFSR
jgi:diguanylate cyclase (GGDEF)-like protein